MAYDRRDGHGDGHCYRIQAVMFMINTIAMVLDIVVGMNLFYM